MLLAGEGFEIWFSLELEQAVVRIALPGSVVNRCSVASDEGYLSITCAGGGVSGCSANKTCSYPGKFAASCFKQSLQWNSWSSLDIIHS